MSPFLFLFLDVQTEEAGSCFSQLLEMSPNNGLAHVGMGTKLLQEGKYLEAIRSLAQGELPCRTDKTYLFTSYLPLHL